MELTYPPGSELLLEMQRQLAEDADLLQLVAVMARMNVQERAVFHYLGGRHLVGRERYGELDVLTDPRNFEDERAQECGDLLMYTAFLAVASALRKRAA